jgi:hypothetical protein
MVDKEFTPLFSGTKVGMQDATEHHVGVREHERGYTNLAITTIWDKKMLHSASKMGHVENNMYKSSVKCHMRPFSPMSMRSQARGSNWVPMINLRIRQNLTILICYSPELMQHNVGYDSTT